MTKASTFIQWKGTDICMDFHCECGNDFHVDGYFVYSVLCKSCGTIWTMPTDIAPQKYDPVKHPWVEGRDHEIGDQDEEDDGE